MAPSSLLVIAGVAASALVCCNAFAPSRGLVAPSRAMGSSCSLRLRGNPSGVRSSLRTPSVMSAVMEAADQKTSTSEEFWTRPRTTNANWGVFFEIVAKDKPIWITGIRAGGHSFADHNQYTRMNIRVFSAEGSAVGKELDEKAWSLVGKVFHAPSIYS